METKKFRYWKISTYSIGVFRFRHGLETVAGGQIFFCFLEASSCSLHLSTAGSSAIWALNRPKKSFSFVFSQATAVYPPLSQPVFFKYRNEFYLLFRPYGHEIFVKEHSSWSRHLTAAISSCDCEPGAFITGAAGFLRSSFRLSFLRIAFFSSTNLSSFKIFHIQKL